ncbi:hypothetical protein [Stygiolobus caldivivus]|uniref:Uncharacterized protein n=1 Tax=Stygiolobus caldivivus TaxID=2824673 RepID=A0A8D5U5L2_9CREN|nr:hypothetical protein [Stygiolobus caldivivus]BCU69738.1 hypothetical protein KN1_10350 [Stygiolobus caldivivus]
MKLITVMDEVIDWFNNTGVIGITINSQGLYIADSTGIRRVPKMYMFFAVVLYGLALLLLVVILSVIFLYVFKSPKVDWLTGAIVILVSSILFYKITRLFSKYISRLLYNVSKPIAPWSRIKAVSVTDRRADKQLVYYVNLGDWSIMTYDGESFMIRDIEAPVSKLEYVKEKLGLWRI